jgi:hypothetical protein
MNSVTREAKGGMGRIAIHGECDSPRVTLHSFVVAGNTISL